MKTVTPEYRSDYNRAIYAEGKAEGKAEGEAEGEAKAIITVLESRGLALSGSLMRKMRSNQFAVCTIIMFIWDSHTLWRWRPAKKPWS